MTKLSGTSGQIFSGLAESLNIRGTSRSAKSAGAKSQGASSFNDLLHTVSSLAKQALTDEGSDTTAKAGTLRTHLAHPAGKDKSKDETDDRTEAIDVIGSGDQTTDKSSETQGPVGHDPKDVSNRPTVAAIMGQDLIAASAVKPTMPSQSGDKKDAREERSSGARREVSAAAMAKASTADSAPSAAVPTGARAQGGASQAAAAQGSDASAKAMPATSGFEAVTANVERVAKVSTRDALPETTKVTVVQQETHLPPAQFNAPQQVANAVVAELKDSAGPAASAAPDLSASQANAPDQPLKILTINLEPPALGNVTVRLRLVGTEVSVHLAAARKDTSQMLDQQRDQIRDLMQSAGYVADVAPVQHGSLDGFQSGSGQSQPQLSGQQQPSSQSQGTFGGAGTSSGQSDGGAKQARQERQPSQETRHDQDVAPHLRRGPVYL
ncbi:flagellar hook-length control protein FliK [Bradyrhizobium symbiodeficiens]|uniref:Flagellar hook-length control protein FliK n=1 Tax=Bradyrhizobium symbiodeficiens TaxID=1404367 RepID=A0ABX5W9Q5_9BRAD|nr:flagellar hook-length control protein FliK [Bradyrhizobium symbiodeficiens]QDF39975.1 flagellar hook-length control protein FliK [Bradyrhizobium symbiodeficiens]